LESHALAHDQSRALTTPACVSRSSQVFQQVDVTPDLTTFRLAAECCMQACGGTDWVGLNEAMALPDFMHKVWGIEATRDVRIAVIDCCLAWMRSGKTGAERRAADAISQVADFSSGRFSPFWMPVLFSPNSVFYA
jgi:hypothetical protein